MHGDNDFWVSVQKVIKLNHVKVDFRRPIKALPNNNSTRVSLDYKMRNHFFNLPLP